MPASPTSGQVIEAVLIGVGVWVVLCFLCFLWRCSGGQNGRVN